MKSEAKLPGFSSALSKEQSILYDYYCYKDLLSFDYVFSSKNLEVSLDSSFKKINSIRSGLNFDLTKKGFTSSLSFDSKSPPSMTLRFPSKKFNLSRVSKSFFSQNSFIRPSLQLSLSSSNNQYRPSATLSAAVNSKSFKAKLKANEKRLTGNCTFGHAEMGGGVKTSFSLKDFAFVNYSVLAWYCEELMNVKLNYTGYFKDSLKNRLNAYFFYQMFGDIAFAAKFTTDLKNNNLVLIGWEGTVDEKTCWKVRVNNKGKAAFAFNAKPLPRTKTRVSFEVNFSDFSKSKFGTYFSFHAKPEGGEEEVKKIEKTTNNLEFNF
jgi:hypothetical protein